MTEYSEEKSHGRILVIDDEREICRSLKGVLSDEGYQADIALTPLEALKKVEADVYDLVLLDIWFGKDSWDGVHLLDRLKQIAPLVPIIMISGHGTLELAVQAMKKGAYDFIEKPFEIERLLLSIERALENFRLSSKNIFKDLKEKELFFFPIELDLKLKKAALTDSRMLFTGESGTGKCFLAHRIHWSSVRTKGAFVILSAFDLNGLTEEEFFGIENREGVQKVGLLERLQNGTCFLKNVHQLNDVFQSYFERLWDKGAFMRVGGQKWIPLNVRFLAGSTELFLTQRHNFRKEFYDRITANVYALNPLRERQDEINLWVETFLKELSYKACLSRVSLGPNVLRALQVYDWPGNLTEMRNLLENALLRMQGHELTLSCFPREVGGFFSSIQKDIFSLSLQEARAWFEYYYLSSQLAVSKGNVSSAARKVGMERSALHRKIKYLKERNQSLF